MTKLSVNINKFATLRNARGGNNPDVIQAAKDCERFGAQGITVHPRPDERHITTEDVYLLKEAIKTEYNIEGYPDKRYLQIIEELKPTQATLVPDPPEVLTSNRGWDTKTNLSFLKELMAQIKSYGVRTSIFVDPSQEMISYAKETGTDRIELYTEQYAVNYADHKSNAIKPYIDSVRIADKIGLGVNAGHDLNLQNLAFFKESIPNLKEVSIGHALICDAIYFGLENTIQLYLRQLK
jgi:pyridoxine 5-phosphate synthase